MSKKLFYSLRSTCIVLSILAFSLSENLSAQSNIGQDTTFITVTGLVKDAKTKQPVSSAQIKALNWNAAASAQDDGSFKIKVKASDEVLIVTAFDYGAREISLKGRDTVVVYLYSDVFTNSYKTIESLTGRVYNSLVPQSINSIDNFYISPFVSADDQIQAQLGGNIRAIRRSGVQGIGTSLFVRGYNSLNANNQPLIVVDGVVWDNSYDAVSIHNGFYTNPLATIDIGDIESVSLIKDGASIYGSKASNGVILIQTNRPKGVVTKITANGFIGVNSKPENIPMMDAEQFRIYASDMVQNTSISKDFITLAPTKPYYAKYHNNTDWSKEVYQPGVTQGYSLSVNGGDERALYVFSLGYTHDKGVVKTSSMQRLNARFKADINFTDKLNTKWNIGYINSDRYLFTDGVNDLVSPTFLAMIKSPFLSPYSFSVNNEQTSSYDDSDDFGTGNPSAILTNAENKNFNKQFRFNVSVMPSYQLSSNWSIKDHFDYDIFNIRENFFKPKGGSDTVDYVTFVSKNEVIATQSRYISLFNDAQLKYEGKFNQYHRIYGVFGWRYMNNYFESDYGEGHNTSDDGHSSLGDASIKFYSGTDNKTKSVSTYTSIDYSFKNRYLVTVAASMDASSRFGDETKGGIKFLGKQWGLFPSVNAAWIISSESFMQKVGFVDRLKLRAGYGITGNDGLDNHVAMPYFISKKYMGKAVGLIIGNVANKSIQWETSYKANAGFDLNILNEVVGISADFYTSNTKDLLVLKSYPEITGLTNYWGNSGELSNKGFEINADFKVLNLKQLKWELSLSAGHYKNKIVSLPDGDIITKVYGGEVLTSVGKPAAVFYGYKTNGVYATQTDAETDNLIMVDNTGNTLHFGAGDIRFVEKQVDGVIDDNDKQVIGDPNPDVYGSFSSMFSIKDFTIDVLFTYSYGNDVYNYLRSQLEGGSNLYNQTTNMLNRWRVEGQQTSVPRAAYGDPMDNSRFSDRWIEDGSYLKLKTISLSYKVPIKSQRIEAMSIWVSTNNVFTFTKYLGLDPEFSANNSLFYQGTDIGLLPNTRSYFAGVKINF